MHNKSPIDEKTLIFGLINSGRHSEALPLLKRLSKSSPKDSGVWLLLGIAHGGLGNYKKAVENFVKSIKLNPGLAESYYYLGRAQQSQGKMQESLMSYQKAIAINPQSSELHAYLGLAYKAVGKNHLATSSLQEAIHLQPGNAELYFNLGNLHQGQRELEEAQSCYWKATQLKPEWISAHLALSKTLLLKGEVEKALEVCHRLQSKAPGDRAVVGMEASILEHVGDLDGARQKLQPLVDAGTSDADALITYSKLAPHSGNHLEVINLLEDRLGSGNEDTHDSRRLHFALADVYDAIESYDQAFSHYQKGNALKTGKFDPNEWRHTIDMLIRTFSAAFLESRGCATNRAKQPVFIVGMPRTGSTLLEQILGRHSGVFGAGELPDMKNIATALPGNIGVDLPYPECLDRLDLPVINQVADDHLRRLDTLSKGALRVIDKMPGNYLHLGLIQILFPGASILHTVRDPLDTCLSCFTRDLGGGASFSADLESLGEFYKEYRRLLDHWKDVLQIRILDVRYEELIEDYEAVVRGAVDFCGLDWEDRCLDHLGNSRVVATPSYSQVRKPLYKGSVAKWKHYETHLGPLIDTLNG